MTRREADELGLIENGIWINPVARKSWFKYPFLKSPDVLGYNRAQVLAIENHVQKGLINKNQLEIYRGDSGLRQARGNSQAHAGGDG